MKEIQMNIKDIELYCAEYSKHTKMFSKIGLPIKKAKIASSNLLLREYGVTINDVYDVIGIPDEGNENDDEILNKVLSVLNSGPMTIGIICNRLRPFNKDDIVESVENLVKSSNIIKKSEKTSTNKIIYRYSINNNVVQCSVPI
tara:strand:- start:110 stop:541 length:432 start_codon:yes stop_codon:yes gene_type:complete